MRWDVDQISPPGSTIPHLAFCLFHFCSNILGKQNNNHTHHLCHLFLQSATARDQIPAASYLDEDKDAVFNAEIYKNSGKI